MSAGARRMAAGASMALFAALGGFLGLGLRERLAPRLARPVRQAIQGGLDGELQAFRIIADLDGDAIPDTFGYSPEPPWHTVRFASRSRRWQARPGEGLEELFATVNEQLRADIDSREPDATARRARFERYRICAANVEHGPVAAVGGRLVVMWYAEPLYPAGINTYDLDGRLLSRYVHPGHLRCMTSIETRAGTFVVFGGTNNFLDRGSARAAGRAPLHVPVVGAIALGENGLDPGLVPVLAGSQPTRFETARVPYYEVVDRRRNSQVVHLRPLQTNCRIAAEYEPGSIAGGGYAARESTAVVHLCGASLRGCTFSGGSAGRIAHRGRFQWPS